MENHQEKIVKAFWFNEPSVRKILNTLNNSGQGEARFVGGCVRNTLLGAKVTDIDIATTILPDDVMDIMMREGVTAIPTGLKYGTVTAIYGEQKFEITTLRRDVATDGRYAEVVYTDAWEQDAARRDFTINALYVDKEGKVYDFFDGIADLDKKNIRFIGDAHLRITEDVLRILRYFRFQSIYGTLDYDAQSLKACADLAHLIPNLSAERVREEFLKTLASKSVFPTLEKMKQAEVLTYVLPEALLNDTFKTFVEHDMRHQLSYAVGRLAALTPESSTGVVAERLKLSNQEKQFLIQFHDAKKEIKANKKNEIILYRFGREIFFQASLYVACEENKENSFEELYQNYRSWRKPVFPLSGKDLISQGVKPGKEMGDVLKQVEEWWLEQETKPQNAECLEKAKSLL